MGGSGGFPGGPDPHPPLAYVVGFLTLGLKLDPLLDTHFSACRPKMHPLLKNPGSAPENRLYIIFYSRRFIYSTDIASVFADSSNQYIESVFRPFSSDTTVIAGLVFSAE